MSATGSAPDAPSGDRPGPHGRRSRRVATLPIHLYQRTISPLLGARCRYYPSCSEYARLSIERFGILRGIVLASWRLLRCNPLSRGGFDYPEDQRLFHRRRPASNAP